MSLYDIAKSGKYAHLTRIEYALKVGLDVEAESIKAKKNTNKRNGECELSLESIAMILTARNFGKKYRYIMDMVAQRHENIRPETLRNRVLEVTKSKDIPKGDEMRAAKVIEMNIRKNNKSS